MIDLSVIIVSYNNLSVLKDCLDSIKEKNDIGDRLQTIVVEQSPTDEIYNYLIENYNWVDTVRAENKGFGAGNNKGVEFAKGKYLLLLNPDTILVEPIAGFAVNTFESNSNIGLFGVQLLDADKKRTSSFEYIVPYAFFNKLKYKIYHLANVFDENNMYIQGADIFVRKDLFTEIGGFDEKIFMYCEEPDLCLRVIRNGYQITYYPSKKIIHLQGACSSKSYEKNFTKQIKSFKYFSIKYGYNFKKIMYSELKHQNFKKNMLKFLNKQHCESYKIAEIKTIVINNILKNIDNEKDISERTEV